MEWISLVGFPRLADTPAGTSFTCVCSSPSAFCYQAWLPAR